MSTVGVALDVDGVLVRGKNAVPRAAEALDLLDAEGLPWMLLTNGGGSLEYVKAEAVGKVLGRPIPHDRVVVAHTPMKPLATKYKDKLVLFTGRKNPRAIADAYGFNRVVTLQELHVAHPSLYPDVPSDPEGTDPYASVNEPISAVVVLMDPLMWERESQILCDVFRSDGTLHNLSDTQVVPAYFAGPDFVYAAEAPVPRFGSGAFLHVVESLFQALTGRSLEVTRFGKPFPVTFEYAQAEMEAIMGSAASRLWMIGDNPTTDIQGANNMGGVWQSALVRTGIFKGAGNDSAHPGTIVADDVYDAVVEIVKQSKE